MIISLHIYNDDQAKFLIRNRLISYNFSFLTMVESIEVYRLTTYSLKKGCITCTYTYRALIRSVLIIFIRNQQLFLDSRYTNDTSSDWGCSLCLIYYIVQYSTYVVNLWVIWPYFQVTAHFCAPIILRPEPVTVTGYYKDHLQIILDTSPVALMWLCETVNVDL